MHKGIKSNYLVTFWHKSKAYANYASIISSMLVKVSRYQALCQYNRMTLIRMHNACTKILVHSAQQLCNVS